VKCCRPAATRKNLEKWETEQGYSFFLGLTPEEVLQNLEQFKKSYSSGINMADEEFARRVVEVRQKHVSDVVKHATDIISSKFRYCELDKSLEVLDILKKHGMYLNCIADKLDQIQKVLEDKIIFKSLYYNDNTFPFLDLFYFANVDFSVFKELMTYEVEKSLNLDYIARFIASETNSRRRGTELFPEYLKRISWILPYVYAKTTLPVDALKTTINTMLMQLI
jgi:hypothetical protein